MLAAQLDVDVVVDAHVARDLVAAAARNPDVDAHPQRIQRRDAERPDRALVEDLQAAQPPDPAAQRRELGHRLSEQLRAVEDGVAPGAVQRGEQQAARAGRGHEPQGMLDAGFVEIAAVAEVQHPGLREAPAVLVGARDDEVGPRRQRVLGQRLAEGQVRAPRLVDDQRHAVGVGHAREAADVGDRAVVRGGDDDRGRRVGRAGQRRVERGRQDAVRDAQPGVDLRRHERRSQTGEDHPVDRAAVDGALHHDALAALRDGQAGRDVALRGAVGEKPRPPRAPGLGGELPGELVGRGGAARVDVDALDQRGKVERERVAPECPAQLRVGGHPALVARHHRAARIAGGEGEQRLEIGRPALAWVLCGFGPGHFPT